MSVTALSREPVSWSGELLKDTLTYRLIDISTTLIDLVMENQSAADHYQSWIENHDNTRAPGENAAITPLVLSELRNESGSQVLILALPQPGQFLCVFTTADFTAKVIVAQDYDTAELQAASVSEFTGDITYALVWSRDFIDRIDEEMLKAGM